MNNSVVIVAGGSGKRFGSQVPKQFLELRGKPVVMHTIEAFHRFDPILEIVLVLPELHIDFWNKLKQEHSFKISHTVVPGGEERFHSVKNGLLAVKSDGVIGIHDAVRPLVSEETLRNCYETALQKGNAVPVIPLTDSIRKLSGDDSTQVDRSVYRLVQTPQCFKKEIILEVFSREYSPAFTDDASVAECAGHHINLVSGNRENIKITGPEDLLIAAALMP